METEDFMTNSIRSALSILLASTGLAACGGVYIDPGITDSCSESNDSCPGQTICVFGLCEPAFPRIFTISVDQVLFADTDRNGGCWDLPCGPPDPYVVIQVDGREVGRTSERPDTFGASWGDIFQVSLDRDSDLEIIALDTDIDTDDEAVTCSAFPVSADLLRARTLSCGDRGRTSYAHVTIDPR